MSSAFSLSSSPPTQDTADYVKPVTFSVEYSLVDPDYGPMLDDGWPTTLRVSVHPNTLGRQLWHLPHPHPHLLPEAQARVPRAQGSFSSAAPSRLWPHKPPTGSFPPPLRPTLTNECLAGKGLAFSASPRYPTSPARVSTEWVPRPTGPEGPSFSVTHLPHLQPRILEARESDSTSRTWSVLME